MPTLSSTVEEVVMKALAKDPKERFARVNDLAAALEKASKLAQQGTPAMDSVSQDADTSLQPHDIHSAQKPVMPAPEEVASHSIQRLAPNRSSQMQRTGGKSISEALVFLEKGLYEEALATLDSVLTNDSHTAYAHSARGLALYRLKRYPEALSSLDRAAIRNQKDITAHYGRGLVLEQLHRFDDALVAFQQVTSLDFTYVMAWSKIGDVLAELKRYEEALTAYDKALQLDSKNPDAYIGKGNVLKRLGRLK